MDTIKCSLVFLIFVLVVFAEEADDAKSYKEDEVWMKRAEEADKVARYAYQPNPMAVTDNVNNHVHKSLDGSNSTRRGLKKESGPCTATNPIDQCWRCQKNWVKNRKKLADCVLGFGRHTTGGKGGKFYVVTDPSDNDLVNPKPGTLRHAVIQPEPLWIIFAHDMTIRLSQELIMTSNKTIDGRGAQIHIANGAGFTLQYIRNVIIHNIRIHNIKVGNGGLIRDSVDHYGTRTKSDGDGISIFGSINVWIDHVSMSRCDDGLIDIIEASTAITISNCHFAKHYEALLFGASDSYEKDSIMQVTLAFNHFGKGMNQRMPRVRYGFVHIVNNRYTRWEMYAIGGSKNPTILSQGNEFTAPNNPFAKEVTKRDYSPESVWKDWVWKSEGDLFRNGAYFRQSGDPKHKFGTDSMIQPKPGKFARTLSKYSGPLKCIKNKEC